MPLQRLKTVIVEAAETPVSATETSQSGSEVDTIAVAAAYMLEFGARVDRDYHILEQVSIHNLLKLRFGLSDLEAKRLSLEAATLYEGSVDWLEQVKQMDTTLTLEQRRMLIEMMWEVVHADGIVRESEVMLMDNVAWLLGIPEELSAHIRAGVSRRTGVS